MESLSWLREGSNLPVSRISCSVLITQRQEGIQHSNTHTCMDIHTLRQAHVTDTTREQRGSDNVSLCISRPVCVLFHTILPPCCASFS